MAKTPVFSSVRRALRLAARSVSTRERLETVLEIDEAGRHDRREFLKRSAAAAAVAATPPLLAACTSGRRDAPTPLRAQIAIVGAGVAGISAAYHLQNMGRQAFVFEASSTVGGRMRSGRNLIAAESTVDLGAEFIATRHLDMHDLARAVGVQLIGLETSASADFADALYFEGRLRSERELAEAFRPLAKNSRSTFNRSKAGSPTRQ